MPFLRKNEMILSFHPMIEADKNIICAGRDPDDTDKKAIQNARAVILPQGCRIRLYQMAVQHCHHVFPNYNAMIQYPGKTGQIRLFQKWQVPHPKSLVFDALDQWHQSTNLNIRFPCVFKFSWGGEGHTVYYIDSKKNLDSQIAKAAEYEKTGQYGFIIQEYIPCQGRSLRMVIVYQSIYSYWRIHADSFYSNIAKGATIAHGIEPELEASAKSLMIDFCQKTHINLAGFDFIFHEKHRTPLFLEINYFFGRKGLGGGEAFYKILISGVKDWLKSVDNKCKFNR
jgi:ribosomal protein S6--L-glutamate ligase